MPDYTATITFGSRGGAFGGNFQVFHQAHAISGARQMWFLHQVPDWCGSHPRVNPSGLPQVSQRRSVRVSFVPGRDAHAALLMAALYILPQDAVIAALPESLRQPRASTKTLLTLAGQEIRKRLRADPILKLFVPLLCSDWEHPQRRHLPLQAREIEMLRELLDLPAGAFLPQHFASENLSPEEWERLLQACKEHMSWPEMGVTVYNPGIKRLFLEAKASLGLQQMRLASFEHTDAYHTCI
ncbi:MAG: hypothetical protein EA402_14295 [Planctomycetota bacterium]|nr:MAG: hypothetical protein EA402_14295 [Planctomycetota bacterium]